MSASLPDASSEAESLFSLGDDAALDVQRAGAKAAWLARGLRAGLPVLPGLVVDAAVSKPYLNVGVATLTERGSGAARLAIVGETPPPVVAQLEAAAGDFAEPIVVRSSSVLETGGEWSGAFTSYLDLLHGELGVGVLGCWASVFTAASLERFEAVGLTAGEAPMAVLIQPALQAEFGGTARLVGDAVEVAAVKGSPGPLVQGWDPGVAARVDAAGQVEGPGAVALLGNGLIAEVATLMRTAHEATGATGCEWGFAAGDLTLFQLTRTAPVEVAGAIEPSPAFMSDAACNVAALVRRFPGAFGEALVLPWAVGLPELPAETALVEFEGGADRLDTVRQIADRLTAQVWGRPKAPASQQARRSLQGLRGTDPATALAAMGALRPPDSDAVELILGLLAGLADEIVGTGLITDPRMVWHLESDTIAAALGGRDVVRRDRFGFDRWEPFTAAVVSANGKSSRGQSAGGGVAAGRLCRVLDTEDMKDFRPRDVLVSTHPVPNLAPLLWDAAGIITTGGSPGAHLFESARALGIPAICGIRLEEIIGGDLASVEGEWVLAMDGSAGTVTALPW